jgi:hypothetical protein
MDRSRLAETWQRQAAAFNPRLAQALLGSRAGNIPAHPRKFVTATDHHAVIAWIIDFLADVSADMADASKRSQMLREQAERCRRLARATTDAEAARKLLEFAVELEARAKAEETRSRCGWEQLRTKLNLCAACWNACRKV